jgi:hypothetical protein
MFIPPTAAYSSSSFIRSWYDRPKSGRRPKWSQSHPTRRNLKKYYIQKERTLHYLSYSCGAGYCLAIHVLPLIAFLFVIFKCSLYGVR